MDINIKLLNQNKIININIHHSFKSTELYQPLNQILYSNETNWITKLAIISHFSHILHHMNNNSQTNIINLCDTISLWYLQSRKMEVSLKAIYVYLESNFKVKQPLYTQRTNVQHVFEISYKYYT